MGIPRRPALVSLCLLVGALIAGGRVASASAEAPALAQANARWRGARCRIRYDIEIKKGTNKEGWSRSPIMLSSGGNEKPFNFLFEVSNRDALAGILRDGRVPAGTDFVAAGWNLVDPAKQRGLYLELRFANAPVTARWWFIGRGHVSGDSFPLERLEQVERYLRIDAFALAAANDQLVAVPADRAVGSAAGQPAAAAPPAAAATVYKPRLRMVAVAAQPAQLEAGSEVDLVLSYVVDGIPPGASFEVVERREIALAGTVVAAFDQALSRVADTYNSAQRVRLPALAAKGLYTVRGRVTMGGVVAEATGLLEVK